MAWEHATGTVSGIENLLTTLAEWLDSGRSWDAESDKVVCDATIRGSVGVDPIQLCHASTLTEVLGSISHPRWSSVSGVFPAARQRLWRFQKRAGGAGDVDFWLVADVEEIGNLGVFCLLTSDVDNDVSQFEALFSSGHPNPITSNNPTAPRFASVYPTFGAETYHFFSDGFRVHVAFRRTTALGTSWQHFSFGTIRKASSAWDGGEYFSGCCAGPSTEAGWDYSQDPDETARQSTVVLSSPFRTPRFSGTALNVPDCHAKGLIRVVGIADADPTFTATRTVNYCALGDILTSLNNSSSPPQPTTTSHDRDAVGSVAVLGGLSAYQQIVGNTSGSAAASPLNLLEIAPNTWDRRSPGIGVDLFAFDYGNSYRWQLLGSVDGIRFVNAEFIADEATVNTDWVVLPVSSNNAAQVGALGHTNFGTFGIAYRKQG